ncbi:permease [Fusibacter tunisiensis]|uniref:Uncharacterized membrane protein YraQ (UPF0718 family) n=1 Tax=Fusibacter tunisiensis TaxID=1008308 RepID=A0ABS2MPF7_9FIRM|nr:permease [Fusibacter tunisiensis]MBM7561197.1 uncharacterized membrane protein YraQ (UPF0718 family) [Fusibacter tunisiensis]
MKPLQMIRKNKLMFAVGVTYLALLVTMPEKATQAFGNSVYYLVEMFQVLPVIFLLTVVIEALIPKEMIIKRFGEKSGFMGNILALVLGSISAGPIYAAFPISKMLLSKGASVANVVIVISSWAVVKVPMLANEAKFLGVDFMAARWVLTVIFIFVMGAVMNRLVSRSSLDAIGTQLESDKLSINSDFCVGCGICVNMAPNIYEISDKKAIVILDTVLPAHHEIILATVKKCPTQAIAYNQGGIR